MNIFILDYDIQKSVEYHCDKHVCKMTLEYAQLLCTTHRVLGSEENEILYRITHINHPWAIWTRTSDKNYLYLFDLFIKLSNEYTLRYKKNHLTYIKLNEVLSKIPENIPKTESITSFPLCMPEEFKVEDAVASYRNFYLNKSEKFKMTWKERKVPEWMVI